MFECHNNMEYQNTNVTNNKTYYPRQIGRPNSKSIRTEYNEVDITEEAHITENFTWNLPCSFILCNEFKAS